ncbi:DUF2889 domain-containing protein [Novosphingobium sp. G106]|uniref:DUF2889 domain-containing protein n=1 Tax=Novosphingobium sp. G106 TaxID=2849500 RepID=UPI001C2D3A08|nr:DUF2889 domain-containing protein [Novosphingobium sp. G106]MBV1691319.1 DUF2889 domain-containing protein [Novosphingobium sp. G106]
MSATGAFRRRVSVATRKFADGRLEARCAVEDEFHRFRVQLEASDSVITAARNDARRSPNTLCEAAGQRLVELVGMALDPACAAVLNHADQFQQCTHQFDLAGLGVAAMALERPRRTYDVTVPDRIDGHTVATLDVDGQPMLRWRILDMTVEGPAPYEARSLGAGFTQFTRSLGREEAEAALVMRRALFVSQGRGHDLEALGNRGPVGGCWAWQPERMAELRRLPENRRDFSDRAEALLADDAEWLDFRS